MGEVWHFQALSVWHFQALSCRTQGRTWLARGHYHHQHLNMLTNEDTVRTLQPREFSGDESSPSPVHRG